LYKKTVFSIFPFLPKIKKKITHPEGEGDKWVILRQYWPAEAVSTSHHEEVLLNSDAICAGDID